MGTVGTVQILPALPKNYASPLKGAGVVFVMGNIEPAREQGHADAPTGIANNDIAGDCFRELLIWNL